MSSSPAPVPGPAVSPAPAPSQPGLFRWCANLPFRAIANVASAATNYVLSNTSSGITQTTVNASSKMAQSTASAVSTATSSLSSRISRLPGAETAENCYNYVERGAGSVTTATLTYLAGIQPKEKQSKEASVNPGFSGTIDALVDRITPLAEKEAGEKVPNWLMSNMSLKDAIRAGLRTIVSNLAAEGQKIRGAGASVNPMADLLACIVDIAEKHMTGRANPDHRAADFFTRIADIETNTKTTKEQKDKKLEELFAPVMKELLSKALPQGISALNLGKIANLIANTFVLPKLADPQLLVELYRTLMLSPTEMIERKERIAKGEGGELLLQGLEKITQAMIIPAIKKKVAEEQKVIASKALASSNADALAWFGKSVADTVASVEPTMQKVERFAGRTIHALLVKAVDHLAKDKTRPLVSALETLRSKLEPFLKQQGTTLREHFRDYQCNRARIKQLEAPGVVLGKYEADELAQKRDWIEKWKKDPARKAIFVDVAKEIWDAADIADEPALSIFDLKKDISELIPDLLADICEMGIDYAPAALDLLATAEGDEKERKLFEGSVPEEIYLPVCEFAEKLFESELPKLVKENQGKIEDEALKALSPHLSMDAADSLKKIMQGLFPQVLASDIFAVHRKHAATVAFPLLIRAMRNLATDPGQSFESAVERLKGMVTRCIAQRGPALKNHYQNYQQKKLRFDSLESEARTRVLTVAQRNEAAALKTWFDGWEKNPDRALILIEFQDVAKEVFDASGLGNEPLLTQLRLVDKIKEALPAVFATLCEKALNEYPALLDLVATSSDNASLRTRVMAAPDMAQLKPITGLFEQVVKKAISDQLPDILKKGKAKALKKVIDSCGRPITPGCHKAIESLVHNIISGTAKQHPGFVGTQIEHAVLLSFPLLTQAIHNIATDKSKPLASSIERIKEMLTPFLKEHGADLKRLYKDYQAKCLRHMELKALVASGPDKARDDEIAALELEFKEWKKSTRPKEIEELFEDLSEDIWNAANLADDPMMKLFDLGNELKGMIPGLLCTLCETVLEEHPIALDLLVPQEDNAALRKELTVSTGNAVMGDIAGMLSHVLSELLKKKLPSSKLENKVFAQFSKFFAPSAADEQAVKDLIGTTVNEIAGSELLRSHIERLVLMVFSHMTADQQQAIVKSLFAVQSGSGGVPHPIASMIESLMQSVAHFLSANSAAIDKAISALPATPTEADLQAIYPLFLPLIDDLLESSGLLHVLARDPALSAFVRSQLPEVCLSLYREGRPRADQSGEKLRKDVLAPVEATPEEEALIDELLPIEDAAPACANEAANGIDVAQQLITSEVTNYAKKYLLKKKGHILNQLFSAGTLDGPRKKALGSVIEHLASSQDEGMQSLWGYVQKMFSGSLSKAVVNLIQGAPNLIPTASGQHPKQLVLANIVAHLSLAMERHLKTLPNDDDFKTVKNEFREQQKLIKRKIKEIDTLKKDRALPGEQKQKELARLRNDLQLLKQGLEKIQEQMRPFFMPIAEEMMKMVSGGLGVENESHPLQALPFLSEKEKKELWEGTLCNFLADFVGEHYVQMTPSTIALESELCGIFGSRHGVELCKSLSKLVRDGAPFALRTQTAQLSTSLLDVAQKALKEMHGEPAKGCHRYVLEHRDALGGLARDTLQALGSSHHKALQQALWPALQNFSYPVLLKLMAKFMRKIQAYDTPENRLEIVTDLLKMLKNHLHQKNAVTESTGHSYPHQVPAKEMFQQYGDDLHPVIKEVMAAPAEQEQEVRKRVFFEPFIEDLFNKIGLNPADMPVPEAEQAALFKLLKEQLGPLAMTLVFDLVLAGKTRESIQGRMFDSCEVSMWETLQKKSEELRRKNQRFPFGEVAADQSAAPEDDEQRKLNEELGGLIQAFILLIPEPILQMDFLLGNIKQARAEDVGAMLRSLCDENDLVDLARWGISIILPSLFKGTVRSNGTFIPAQPNQEANFEPPTPAQDAEIAKKARELAIDVATEGICTGIYNSCVYYWQKLESAIEWLCKKIGGSYGETVGGAIKDILQYVGKLIYWALKITLIPVARAIIRWRIGTFSDIKHKDRDHAVNRSFGYHALDRLRGIRPRILTA